MSTVNFPATCRTMTSRQRGWTRSRCSCFYDVVAKSLSADFESLTHCEFVSGQDKVCSVRGNLATCYQEWVNIGATGFILSVIRDGYKIPFIVFPPPKNDSALKKRQFVFEAIFNLIRNKCLEVLDHPPAIVNPLSVSIQSSGKKGLILDLRQKFVM